MLVNQSRVFTLQGGDIVIWSSEGNIDAGRGAKSAISAPPPTITVSATGQIQVQFSDAIAGSGIRGILTSEDIEPGDVDLIAPDRRGQRRRRRDRVGRKHQHRGAPGRGSGQYPGGGRCHRRACRLRRHRRGACGASGLAASAAKAAESVLGRDCADADRDGVCDPAAGSLADAAMGWLDVFIEGFGEPGRTGRRRPSN